MRDPQIKVIGGVHFKVTPLGFRDARKAFVRLTKAVGPALAQAAQGGSDLKPEDINMSAALTTLVDRVDDADLEWFADIFGKTTQFSNDGESWPFLRAENREALFGGGQLMLYFEWLVFCLEVNFSDFLDFVRRASAGVAPAGNPSPDSNDSTSQS